MVTLPDGESTSKQPPTPSLPTSGRKISRSSSGLLYFQERSRIGGGMSGLGGTLGLSRCVYLFICLFVTDPCLLHDTNLSCRGGV